MYVGLYEIKFANNGIKLQFRLNGIKLQFRFKIDKISKVFELTMCLAGR